MCIRDSFSELVTKNDLQIDYVVEPDTLLVHEFHYRFSGESRSGLNREAADNTVKIEMSVFNSFERAN